MKALSWRVANSHTTRSAPPLAAIGKNNLSAPTVPAVVPRVVMFAVATNDTVAVGEPSFVSWAPAVVAVRVALPRVGPEVLLMRRAIIVPAAVAPALMILKRFILIVFVLLPWMRITSVGVASNGTLPAYRNVALRCSLVLIWTRLASPSTMD